MVVKSISGIKSFYSMLGRGAQKNKRRPSDLTHQRIKIPNIKKY
jgi:hypothetical protein